MSKNSYVAIFVILLATAFACAQMHPGPGGQTYPGQQQPGQQQPGMGQPTFPGQPSDQQTTTGTDQDRDRDQNRQTNSTPTSTPKAKVDDQTLERQVHEQLATRAEFSQVQVHVKKGMVELDGSVPRKEDRKEARRMAKAVPGVRGVKEKLSINASASTNVAPSTTAGAAGTAAQTSTSTTTNQQPATGTVVAPSAGASSSASTSTESTQIQSQIRSAIQSNSALAASNVANNVIVNVKDNNVVLTGFVPSQEIAQQVLSIAQAHADGRAVVNNLTVSSSASSAGASTSGGVSGTATGAAGSNTSTTPAAGASGAIGSSAGGQQTGASTAMSTSADNNGLREHIANALRMEPTLANDNVTVNLTDNTVELSGSVATGKEKQTALRIAQSYAGNRRVVDHITVTGRGQGANINKSTEPAAPDMGTDKSNPNMGTEKSMPRDNNPPPEQPPQR